MTKTATQLTEVNNILDELQKLIEDTFERLGCSQKELENMVGLNVSINVKNVIVYLGQIEQKATELLNILHYANLKVGHAVEILTKFCQFFLNFIENVIINLVKFIYRYLDTKQ